MHAFRVTSQLTTGSRSGDAMFQYTETKRKSFTNLKFHGLSWLMVWGECIIA